MSISPGALAPWFTAPTRGNPRFAFGSLGGFYLVMAFLPPPGPERHAALAMARKAEGLGYPNSALLLVVPDAESFAAAQEETSIRFFDDRTGEIRRLYGAERADGSVDPQWLLIDPALRVVETAPLANGRRIFERLRELGAPADHAGVPLHAPVLIVPRVFEPGFCRKLIEVYEAVGGEPSGVMRDQDGRTVGVLDGSKKRRDVTVPDEDLRTHIRARLSRRLMPEIHKVFQFRATRIERYTVACYDAEEGGFFMPHRDNVAAGTAHRRFACSINLNAEEFEGGDLRFPEFGPRTYRPPTGGAVVFACELLHEATPVTRGRRYAFLPFFFDEAAEQIRQANKHLLGPSLAQPAGG